MAGIGSHLRVSHIDISVSLGNRWTNLSAWKFSSTFHSKSSRPTAPTPRSNTAIFSAKIFLLKRQTLSRSPPPYLTLTLKFHENSSNNPRKSPLCFSNKNGSLNSSWPLNCIRNHLNAQRCIRPPKNLIFQEVNRCYEYRVNHCQLTRHLHYMEA